MKIKSGKKKAQKEESGREKTPLLKMKIQNTSILILSEKDVMIFIHIDE